MLRDGPALLTDRAMSMTGCEIAVTFRGSTCTGLAAFS